MKAAEHLKRVPARARRQGAAGRARRRRPRRGRRRGAASARSCTQGQICMSTERHRGRPLGRRRARRQARRAGRGAAGRRPARPGDGDRPAGQRRRAASAWRELSRTRVDKGAEVLAGGEADGTCSRRPCSRASRRRCASTTRSRSGRSSAIVPVDGADEAVRVANDTEYGLAAAVFGERRADRARRRPPDRERHLPRQRLDGARRAADAVRRRQGQRLGPLRRPRRRSRSSPSCAGSRSSRARATTRSERRGDG